MTQQSYTINGKRYVLDEEQKKLRSKIQDQDETIGHQKAKIDGDKAVIEMLQKNLTEAEMNMRINGEAVVGLQEKLQATEWLLKYNALRTYDGLTERLRIAVEALKYYANDPAYDEKTYLAINSNFRSNNLAKITLAKIGQTEVKNE